MRSKVEGFLNVVVSRFGKTPADIGWLNWYAKTGRDSIDLMTYRRTVRKILQRRGLIMSQWREMSEIDQGEELAWEWHLNNEIRDMMDQYASKKKLTPEVHALFMAKLWAL